MTLPRAIAPAFMPPDTRVEVVRMDGSDAVHGAALGEVLHTVVRNDAVAHGAAFNEGHFSNVLEAIKRKKVQAFFVIVEYENSLPKFAGGAIQFPTVLTKWNGSSFDHYPALYREDIFIDASLSATFRERTKGTQFPRGIGLGAYLTHEEIRRAVCGPATDMPFGAVCGSIVGEYAPDNLSIVNSLRNQGADLGTPTDSAVLIFEDELPLMAERIAPFVHLEEISIRDLESEPTIGGAFAAVWRSEDESQQIAANFTEAFSTFNGETVVRVNFVSNEVLPNATLLSAVLGTLIETGFREIAERGWLPMSPKRLLPLMRFHCLHEPEIVHALRGMGATTRVLGKHTMMPIVMDFMNIPAGFLDFPLPDSNPLAVNVTNLPLALTAQKQVACVA